MHRCYICRDFIKESNHLGIDSSGDLRVCCDICYDKSKIFFDQPKERKRKEKDNAEFGRSSQAGEQGA